MATATIPQSVLQELQAWSQYRKQVEAQAANGPITDQAVADQYNGKDLSPQAAQYATNYANGQPYYNPDTGQVSTAGGAWSNPETWLQIAAGAGIGGVAAAGALGAAGAPAAAGSSVGDVAGTTGAFNAAGDWVPAVAGAGAAGSLSKYVLPSLIGVGGQLAGTVLAQQGQSAAATTAANALEYSANLQDAANQRAEVFSRQQAENSFANSEVTRQANYNQWAAREARVSSLGQALGLSARDIPAYVPGVDPNYTGGSSGSSSSSVPLSSDITDALTKNYQSLGATPTGPGTGPTDLSYFAQRIADTGGLTPQNTAYWFGPNGRIAQELQKAGG
jgi:hypothetical protein